MEYAKTCYTDDDTGTGYYKVYFLINSTKEHLVRSFDSLYLAKKFVNKLRFSKKCTLISYPIFDR